MVHGNMSPWPHGESAGVLNQRGTLNVFSRESPSRSLDWKWAAVIPARNEGKTLAAVLAELGALGLDEIVVVANGCTDDTVDVATRSDCRLLTYPSALGHDVGRGIGAQAVPHADGILFVDADIVVPSAELQGFLVAVETGMDVALNDINPLSLLNPKHPVNVAKAFLNLTMGRGDLGYSSMTGIPHALSRKAIDVIGPEALQVPPLAQMRALAAGLVVGMGGSVDVVGRNRIHGADAPVSSGQLEHLILGDHIEAMSYLLGRGDARGGFTDGARERFHFNSADLQPNSATSPGLPQSNGRSSRVVVPRGLQRNPRPSGTEPHPK